MKGKAVLILSGAPPIPDSSDPTKLDPKMFLDPELSYYGRPSTKAEVAWTHGASAVITLFTPRGLYPTFASMNRFLPREAMIIRDEYSSNRIAATVAITTEKGAQLFTAAGQDPSALRKAALSRDFQPVTLKATIAVRARNQVREINCANVVTRLSGSDPQLRDEYVVYSGHWDHLGRQDDNIFHGASDNASGTAGVLELAHAFTRLPSHRPECGKPKVMSLYAKYVLPRIIDLAMRNPETRRLRAAWIPQARGEVLEVGIGSGLNLAFYSSEVQRVYGVDPSVELQQMARKRLGPIDVEFLTQSVEVPLPLASASIDTVVLTWTLCSIANPQRALQEMKRVLKASGSLIFVEHGRAPDPGVAVWQDRLTPLWKRIGGGCHLNRRIDEIIKEAGFQIPELTTSYIPGPRPMTYTYQGVAQTIR